MKTFTHLHVSSAYSLKYGTTQPSDLVARASEYGMPAIALTDRDGLAGAIRFAQSWVAYGIALINSWLFLVRGEVRRTGPRGVSLRATGAWELRAAYEKHSLSRGLRRSSLVT